MNARLRKVLPCAALVLLTVLWVAGCGSSGTDGTTATTAGSRVDQVFTVAALAEFDGRDGRPAYVAVDGVVYDVSDSLAWPEGMHSSCNLGAAAGKDLSDVIDQAPSNMRSLLERMPVVGSLVQ